MLDLSAIKDAASWCHGVVVVCSPVWMAKLAKLAGLEAAPAFWLTAIAVFVLPYFVPIDCEPNLVSLILCPFRRAKKRAAERRSTFIGGVASSTAVRAIYGGR